MLIRINKQNKKKYAYWSHAWELIRIYTASLQRISFMAGRGKKKKFNIWLTQKKKNVNINEFIIEPFYFLKYF